MPILRLLGESVRFLALNSWPVVAAAALVIPLEFALDQGLEHFADLGGQERGIAIAYGVLLLLVRTLIYTFYIGFLYYLIRARLFARRVRTIEFRDWLRPAFSTLFIYVLIITFFAMTGLILLLMPLLIFLPYMEIVILFEKKRLKPALSRNLGLFFLRPWPPALLGVLLIALVGWVPFGLHQAGIGEQYRELYRYSSGLITLPLDAAFMVLYFMLAEKRVPPGFSELDDEQPLEP